MESCSICTSMANSTSHNTFQVCICCHKGQDFLPFLSGWITSVFIYSTIYLSNQDFPHSSVGKESVCNAGRPQFDPWVGRSTGEGICHPLQCSWASLVAQLVKNLPAMWETWDWSLGWEDCLEKGKATHSSFLAWKIPMDYIVHCKE